MNEPALIIEQTKRWITNVVVGCNFCPFAAKELKQNTVHYEVELSNDPVTCLQSFLKECVRLDNDPGIETSFLIMPHSVKGFNEYLDLLTAAEKLIKKNRYEGVYQVASFHPLYKFMGSADDDAANYTNRSPYPMFHLLREKSVEQALEKYTDPERIPVNNIRFAREKGLGYMQKLLEKSMRHKPGEPL